MTENAVRCRNCNNLLSGEYCPNCGQREGRGDLTFGDVAGELVDEVISWDSRLWRTLGALLFRPGFLTAEFIAGHRARYAPPFRLYLIVSFVLFLVVSSTAGKDSLFGAGRGISITTDAEQAQTELQSDSADGGLPLSIDLSPQRNSDLERSDELVLAPLRIGEGDKGNTAGVGLDISLADEDSPPWLQELDKRLEANAEKYAETPDEFVRLLIDHLPQMMFLLLPVFALLLKICYLFSPFHYLQHLVFSLHFHSFAYLLYLVGVVAENLFNGLGDFLPFVFVGYLVLALRRAYGSGFAGAIGKTAVILLVDGFFLLISFALVSVIALAFS